MKHIIALSLAVCIVLYVVEQFVPTSYVIKSLVKIILFVGMSYYLLDGKLPLSIRNIDKNQWCVIGGRSVAYGVGIIVLVNLLPIDLQAIGVDLQTRLAISATTFIFVALYITIINSFIEEVFFRGALYLQLRKQNEYLALFFSAALFAVYHVAIFVTWLDVPILIFATVGLFLVGIVFNLMDKRANSIMPSWIAHIAANIGINIVGLQLFGII